MEAHKNANHSNYRGSNYVGLNIARMDLIFDNKEMINLLLKRGKAAKMRDSI